MALYRKSQLVKELAPSPRQLQDEDDDEAQERINRLYHEADEKLNLLEQAARQAQLQKQQPIGANIMLESIKATLQERGEDELAAQVEEISAVAKKVKKSPKVAALSALKQLAHVIKVGKLQDYKSFKDFLLNDFYPKLPDNSKDGFTALRIILKHPTFSTIKKDITKRFHFDIQKELQKELKKPDWYSSEY